MSRWKSPATAARRKSHIRHETAFWLFAGVGVLVILVCVWLYSKGYLQKLHQH